MHHTFAHENSSLSGQIEKSKPGGVLSQKGNLGNEPWHRSRQPQ